MLESLTGSQMQNLWTKESSSVEKLDKLVAFRGETIWNLQRQWERQTAAYPTSTRTLLEVQERVRESSFLLESSGGGSVLRGGLDIKGEIVLLRI